MNFLPLKNGGFAIVSRRDFASMRRMQWRLGSNGYVYVVGGRSSGKPCLLHRIVMHAKRGEEIHHRNGDKANCARRNLERTSPSEHQKHHSHLLIARNQAAQKYASTAHCKQCNVLFTKHPDHRGRQVCCSKYCAILLAVAGRLAKNGHSR